MSLFVRIAAPIHIAAHLPNSAMPQHFCHNAAPIPSQTKFDDSPDSPFRSLQAAASYQLAISHLSTQLDSSPIRPCAMLAADKTVAPTKLATANLHCKHSQRDRVHARTAHQPFLPLRSREVPELPARETASQHRVRARHSCRDKLLLRLLRAAAEARRADVAELLAELPHALALLLVLQLAPDTVRYTAVPTKLPKRQVRSAASAACAHPRCIRRSWLLKPQHSDAHPRCPTQHTEIHTCNSVMPCINKTTTRGRTGGAPRPPRRRC